MNALRFFFLQTRFRDKASAQLQIEIGVNEPFVHVISQSQ